MTYPHSIRTLAPAILATFALTAVSYGQGAQSAQAPSKPKYATVEKDGQILPVVMHFCAQHCATLTWNSNGYYGAPSSMWTVEKFTPESIVIHRVDSGPYPLTAVLRGKISSEGIADGTISFNSGGSVLPFQLTWGPEIDYIPGSGDPVARARPMPDIPCNSSTFQGSGAEAAARGSHAVELKNYQTASCWLHIGADKGNPDAEGMLAAMLYKGLSGPPSYAQALGWAQKSAAQDSYLGDRVLSLMYASGHGVAKDDWQAQFWDTKAEKDKAAAVLAEQQVQQRQQQQAQRAQAQQAGQSMGALFLLLLGSMDDGPAPSHDSRSSVVCPGDPNNHSGLCH